MSVLNYRLKNGTIYTGQVYIRPKTKKPVPHGNGKALFANGCIYVGTWQHGKMHGIGYFTEPKKNYYNGNFFHNQKDGYGKLTFYKGAIKSVEGTWQKDMLTGIGYICYENGSTYYGEIKNFMMHGLGNYHDIDGTAIRGIWRENKLLAIFSVENSLMKVIIISEQKCRIKYYDGSVYVGSYDSLYRPDGHGKMRYHDKSIYNGFWSNGYRQGYGFYLEFNGDYYNGQWYHNKRHGIGIYCRSGIQAIEFAWDSDHMVSILRKYDF